MFMSKSDQPHTYRCTTAVLILMALIGLTACGNDGQTAEELSAYRTEMETFFTDLETAQNAIEAIDAGDDSAETDLLTQVDAISVSCAAIAAVDPPSGYEEVQTTAEHAAAMMGQASSGFHHAFESTDLDQDSYDAAMEYYKAAGNDIQAMIVMLQNSFDEE